MNFPSKLIEAAVEQFASLPGIGKKTALRLVLHMIKQDQSSVANFSNTIKKMREQIMYCKNCGNVSDLDLCEICSNPHRDETLICVVESIREVMAIENTNQFKGEYHVLGGVISPIEGIGPEDLNIELLINRCKEKKAKELVMALSPTIEGDTTVFYISKQLKSLPINITTIARGVAFGGELEYTDELTLARSIATRLPYENYLVKGK